MGGYGSGRHFYNTKATVEDCLTLDISKYAQWGYLKPGFRSGLLTWSSGGNKIASCGMSSSVEDSRAEMVFSYSYNDEKHSDVKVNLCWYSPGFGGRRYLFVCPHCGRKMRTLQISSGEIACRLCHRLTYKSCNEGRSFDSLYKRMAIGLNSSWQEVKRYMNFMKKAARQAKET